MLVIYFGVIKIIVVMNNERLIIPKYTMIDFALAVVAGGVLSTIGLTFGILMTKLLERTLPTRDSDSDDLVNFK